MMFRWKDCFRVTLVLALLASMGQSAEASTLLRIGLGEMVAANGTVVTGRALSAQSYWNTSGDLILTDVTFEVSDIIRGQAPGGELTVTLVGGRVGTTSNVIIGAPVLVPGESYLLFLNREDLPGAEDILTVRDLCQGAFDITSQKDGKLVAVSQASGQALVPDGNGLASVPGGSDGLLLDGLIRDLRRIAAWVDANEGAAQ